MAKTFPTVEARQELGFTPTTAVRANIDVRTGEGEVGAAIGRGVLAVAGELQERSVREELLRQKNRDNLDSLSKRQADQRRKLTTAQLRTMKNSTPPEKWEEASIPIINAGGEEIAGFDFSPQALAEQQIIIKGDAKVIPKQIFADATRVISAAAVKSAEEMLTDAYRLNLPDLPQRNIDFIKTLKSNGVSAKAVTSGQTAAREAGEKLRKQDTVDLWQDRIAVDAIGTEKILEGELALRKDGEGNIPELDSADIQSLLNTATNRQSQLTADAQAALNKANSELETKLHDGIVAGTTSITEISKSGLPAATKRRLETDIADVAKRDIARTWAIQDSDDTATEINAILTDLEAGQTDINEARSFLAEEARRKTVDGRSVMTKTTYDKVSTQITKGGRDAVDVFTQEQTVQVENFLTGRLTERDAELKVRAQAKTLTTLEKRQVKSVGFLLQVERHQLNLYENALAARIRELGIEDTSGKEAKVEAVKIWETIRQKDLTRKINDFTSASGQVLVRPTDFSERVWESSDAANRAAIVEGVALGFDNKTIEEDLIK